ncbi:glycosyl transferase, partial [Nitrospirota bacterium]
TRVHEAAAHGLPTVVTDALREELGWEHDKDLLSAGINDAQSFAQQCVRLYSNEELWTRVRNNALRRIEVDCGKHAFEEVFRGIVNVDNRPH